MKVALLSIMYPPDSGGAETYAYELSRALAQRGHQVDVYTATTERLPKDLDHPSGVTVERLFKRRKIPVLETIYYSLRARSVVDFSEYDIIHGTMMPASTIALTPGLGMTDVPIVLTSHGTSLGEFRSHNPDSFIDYLLKYGLHPGNFVLDNIAARTVDSVIAISEHVENELSNYYNISDKATMIPHGVDTERFQPKNKIHSAVDPKLYNILTVGRLGPRKGIGLAIRGIAELDSPDVRLLIGGTGRHEDRLRELAQSLGIKEQVKFLGYVPDDELPLLYSSVDVFSLTSRYEGLGLVLLEAMACGTPVVATDVGGVSTVVNDGNNGYLISRDRSEFAKRILELKNPEHLKKMSDEAKRFGQSSSWADVARRVENVYDELVY
ncbi:glycosyltransferase family 4 protein [Halosimplex halophilum]|uniref:glycosyltransferase family 4 protein n=1 Tax=Halosimplex halophilum TaxID=2559572 RepID=UPI00107F12BF|nr:glycosyltransferase family 4 protein [Halosimplex halophilum]